MVYQGIIHNGVVVLDNGVELPEGTPVRVELLAQRAETNESEVSDGDLDPVFRMGELAADAGIPDLSVNIDHYLYGHPKVTDAK
jgi:hypothetical protein